MRIVAGKYRHRLITWPDDATHIRPTKDRIRESIFSAIGDLDNLNVLDLYAGSGAMGLEALSRNANKATFADDNSIAIQTVQKNIKSLNIPAESTRILGICDKNALEKFAKEKEIFDVVFLDPPYQSGDYEGVIKTLFENNSLSKNAIIVIESERDVVIDLSLWKKRKDYHYGKIRVIILWR